MNRKFFIYVLFSITGLASLAQTFSLDKKAQQQILNEAENWMDDMPEGLFDRLSDAVNHAQHGFYSEIEYFRNAADTVGIGKYKVNIKDINGGKSEEIPMRLYSSYSNSIKPLLIYFHGGGWTMGSIQTVDKFCRALASEGQVNVVSVSYPLAPEKPYPVGLNKCVEAVEFIKNNISLFESSQDKISLGGDGAGGNLALETFQKLPGNINIKSLVLFYPLIQTSGNLDPKSKKEYGRGYGFDSRLWEAYISAYQNNSDYYASSKSLPPTLIISPGKDIIIEEVKNFSLSDSNITLLEFENALHGFITDGHQNTAFSKAVEFTNLFLSH